MQVAKYAQIQKCARVRPSPLALPQGPFALFCSVCSALGYILFGIFRIAVLVSFVMHLVWGRKAQWSLRFDAQSLCFLSFLVQKEVESVGIFCMSRVNVNITCDRTCSSGA